MRTGRNDERALTQKWVDRRAQRKAMQAGIVKPAPNSIVFSDDDKRRVRQLWKEGMHGRRIALELGVSLTTFRKLRDDLELSPRQQAYIKRRSIHVLLEEPVVAAVERHCRARNKSITAYLRELIRRDTDARS